MENDLIKAFIAGGIANGAILTWLLLSVIRVQRVCDRLEFQIQWLQTVIENDTGSTQRRYHVRHNSDRTATGFTPR